MTHAMNGTESDTSTSGGPEILLGDAILARGGVAELIARFDEQHHALAEMSTALVEAQIRKSDLEVVNGNQQRNIATYQAQETTLEALVSRLRSDVHRKNNELESFRLEVVRVASEAADEHGWCSTIDDILRELGLERSRPSYMAELTINVSFTAVRTDSRDTPTTIWVHDSIQRDELEQIIHQHFSMDSENEDVEITNISFDVDNVEKSD